MIFVIFSAYPLKEMTHSRFSESIQFFLSGSLLPIAGIVFFCSPLHQASGASEELIFVRNPKGEQKIEPGFPVVDIADHAAAEFSSLARVFRDPYWSRTVLDSAVI